MVTCSTHLILGLNSDNRTREVAENPVVTEVSRSRSDDDRAVVHDRPRPSYEREPSVIYVLDQPEVAEEHRILDHEDDCGHLVFQTGHTSWARIDDEHAVLHAVAVSLKAFGEPVARRSSGMSYAIRNRRASLRVIA